jgi:hypothetical protein
MCDSVPRENATIAAIRRHFQSVIPGTREAREPGIHLPRLAARSWIPGSAAFALRAQVAAPE